MWHDIRHTIHSDLYKVCRIATPFAASETLLYTSDLSQAKALAAEEATAFGPALFYVGVKQTNYGPVIAAWEDGRPVDPGAYNRL